MDWQAFLLTVKLAVLVTAILLLLGLPVAYWLTYSRRRWKFLIEAVGAILVVLIFALDTNVWVKALAVATTALMLFAVSVV